MAEWDQVVDAWQLESWEGYRDVGRLGRKTRLRCAQCLHMRGGKWFPYHLAQVFAYGFHGGPTVSVP
jgi:hypothetical protein